VGKMLGLYDGRSLEGCFVGSKCVGSSLGLVVGDGEGEKEGKKEG